MRTKTQTLRFSLWALVAGGLLVDQPLTHVQASAATLPSIRSALGSDASTVIYCDVAAIRKSRVWQSVASRLSAIEKATQQAAAGTGASVTDLPDLEQIRQAFPWDKLSEIAVVARIKDIRQGLAPDESVFAVGRVEGTIQTDEMIASLMKMANQADPALAKELKSTQRKLGNATFLDLPQAFLQEQSIPFGVSGAISSDANATLLGVGRTDALQGYLQGKTSDALSAKAKELLPRDVSLWIYSPTPDGVPMDMGGGPAADLQGNPMLQGIFQGLSQVRESFLGLTFGDNGLGIDVVMVCADGASAAQMGATFQGLMAFAQMAAQQNPSLAQSSALRSLGVRSDGTAVRVSTTMNLGEIETLFNKAGLQAKYDSTSPEPTASTEPLVEVEFVDLLPGGGTDVRWCRLRVTNRSPHAIQALRLSFMYYDKDGRRLGAWTRRHTDLDAEHVVAAQSERTTKCPVFNMPISTEKIAVVLQEALFANDEKWRPTP